MSIPFIFGLTAVTMVGILWLRRRWLVVAVQGSSMQPTLHEGDRVLVRRRRARHIKRGDVVVLQPPPTREPVGGGRWRVADDGLQVKRVAAVAGEVVPNGVRCDEPRVPAGTLVVISDNLEAGFDSRHWGPYASGGLVGVVVRRIGGVG